jgi:hypothetical protein
MLEDERLATALVPTGEGLLLSSRR